MRRGLLQHFEQTVAQLNQNATANQFEQALMELAQFIGLVAERHDVGGQGPDVLWLSPKKVGFIIEAKSRKKEKNELTKEEHGQLLIAQEWFTRNYPAHQAVRISVHPTNKATRAASATQSYALTNEKLAGLVADSRSLLTKLCESQLTDDYLVAECTREVEASPIRADRLIHGYLTHFVEG